MNEEVPKCVLHPDRIAFILVNKKFLCHECNKKIILKQIARQKEQAEKDFLELLEDG